MNIALLLSGGTGERLHTNVPKQYIEILGKPIISYCMESLFAHEGIHAVQIVADPMWQMQIRAWMQNMDINRKFRGFSIPGANRQLSIVQGLEDIREYARDTDSVFIHDAARPLLARQLITACLEAVKGHDGAVPVLPMKDTIYRSSDQKRLTHLLDRDELYAGQAPEVFCLGLYYEANRRLLPDQILRIHGSAEPAVMAGMDIAMIPGDENNFKITTKNDLERFKEIEERIQGAEIKGGIADESMGFTRYQ